jgi:predicted P-loop ATPase
MPDSDPPSGNVTQFDPTKKRKKQTRPPQPPPPGGWPNWLGRLRRDERGRVIPDLANVMIALRNEEKLVNACAYDEMMQHSIVELEWPHTEDAQPVRPPPHETGDDDIGRLQEWLQRMGIPRIGREIVGQAVEMFARERSFHPIRDWLDTLKWDGVRRIHRWLFSYFGAEAEDDNAIAYVEAIGRMFLIAMVARIFRPGCQADYMLVLEGDQGILKSSACRALAGDWFSDGLPENIHSKDARQHLRGKWLIEVSELAAFSKAETEALKAFITRREERYRPPFGRHDVAEKRQCLFVGTTNQDAYIKDPTGGRRYWPVKCTTIDRDGVEAVREQLFAEAVAAFRGGERHWPNAEDERQFFKPQQERRQEDDPWWQSISEWLDGGNVNQTTVTAVALGALHFPDVSRVSSVEQRRIANILNELGWRRRRTGKGRFYHRHDLFGDG